MPQSLLRRCVNWYQALFARKRSSRRGASSRAKPLVGGTMLEDSSCVGADIVVEAAGVEPASEKARRAKTTCVSDSLNSTAT